MTWGSCARPMPARGVPFRCFAQAVHLRLSEPGPVEPRVGAQSWTQCRANVADGSPRSATRGHGIPLELVCELSNLPTHGAFISRSGAGDCGGKGPCMCQIAEHGLIEQLVAHPTVAALDEPILHGLSRRDVVPFDPVLGTRPQDHITGQFRPMIADYHAGLFAALDQSHQVTRDTAPRYRG